MTVFLTYETEQSMDDMRTLLSATGSIFLTSAPVFDRSVWDDVCEITAKSVGEWVVQKGNSQMLKENMDQLKTFMQDTRAPSLARAALDFISDHDRPALHATCIKTFIIPSGYLYDLFKDEQEFFDTPRYLALAGAYSCHSIPRNSYSLTPLSPQPLMTPSSCAQVRSAVGIATKFGVKQKVLVNY